MHACTDAAVVAAAGLFLTTGCRDVPDPNRQCSGPLAKEARRIVNVEDGKEQLRAPTWMV
jgi:hypothetical protein